MGQISGKVAAIVTEHTIIINRGSNQGVKPDTEFAIQLDLPAIADPDNPKKRLVNVFYEKGRVKISQVYDEFAFGVLIPKTVLPSLQIAEIFKATYPNTDQPLLAGAEWKIQVGDKVTEIPPRPAAKGNEETNP